MTKSIPHRRYQTPTILKLALDVKVRSAMINEWNIPTIKVTVIFQWLLNGWPERHIFQLVEIMGWKTGKGKLTFILLTITINDKTEKDTENLRHFVESDAAVGKSYR